MSPNRRILIIDDEEDFLTAMRMQFRNIYGVLTSKSISDGMKLLEKEDVDLVLLDVGLEGEDGLEGIKKIHAVHPLVSVAMLSGRRDVKTVVQAIRFGAVDYLTKPVENEELAEVIERAVATRSVHERCEALLHTQTNGKNGSTSIIYQSKKMHQLIEQAKQIKGHDVNVLIVGETGTGKDLLARYIHQQEVSIKKRPFIAVNCAAIPEHLLESELFGHEAGAFTGATRRRIGRFELADGGDIFLDEISTMKLDLQVKLLRVLQEREFCRLGSNQPIKATFRVISASNQPLDSLVESGNFRSDLYHRLRVLQINVPPLRERKEDIKILAQHFIEKFTERTQRRRFSERAMAKLTEYSWPGNVRELANVVQSLVIMVRGDIICDTDFPSWVLNHCQQGVASGALAGNKNAFPMSDVSDSLSTLKECAQKAEKEHIARTLQLYDGDKTKTAVALGVGRTTLYMKMKELGLMK